MITAIEIENFKGIGERIRIPLKPITLLFGPNSSGKSTVLHALHYAREILDRHNLDADRTIAGGELVDLGGYANFIHCRRLDEPLRLKFELDVPAGQLPAYIEPDFTPFGFENYVKQASVSFELRWSHVDSRPFVARYAVGINGQPLAALQQQAGRSACEFVDFAADHPIFAEYQERLSPEQEESPNGAQISTVMSKGSVFIAGQPDALPILGEIIRFARPSAQESASNPDEIPFDNFDGDPHEFVRAAMTQLIAGPAQVLRDVLRATRYLGPLRTTPPRDYVPLRHEDPARWAGGLAAWDALYFADADVLAEVNDWLSRPDRLATGYHLRRFDTIDMDAAAPWIAQLLGEHPFDDADLTEVRSRLRSAHRRRRLALVDGITGAELGPPDVGEGIAQIVPVVVALVEEADGLVAVEQPELHVHPAIQVGLGDLLIYATQWHKQPLIIETHSEHLLLRLLKRIRQSTDSDPDRGDFGLRPDDLSVIYMENGDGGVRATPLRIDQTGEFIDRWPKGFFEERAQELF